MSVFNYGNGLVCGMEEMYSVNIDINNNKEEIISHTDFFCGLKFIFSLFYYHHHATTRFGIVKTYTSMNCVIEIRREDGQSLFNVEIYDTDADDIPIPYRDYIMSCMKIYKCDIIRMFGKQLARDIIEYIIGHGTSVCSYLDVIGNGV